MRVTKGRGIIGALLLAVADAVAGAQSVTLQIKPKLSDTLRMRLDQQTEMTGVKRTSNGGEATAMVISICSRARSSWAARKSTRPCSPSPTPC